MNIQGPCGSSLHESQGPSPQMRQQLCMTLSVAIRTARMSCSMRLASQYPLCHLNQSQPVVSSWTKTPPTHLSNDIHPLPFEKEAVQHEWDTVREPVSERSSSSNLSSPIKASALRSPKSETAIVPFLSELVVLPCAPPFPPPLYLPSEPLDAEGQT